VLEVQQAVCQLVRDVPGNLLCQRLALLLRCLLGLHLLHVLRLWLCVLLHKAAQALSCPLHDDGEAGALVCKEQEADKGPMVQLLQDCNFIG
jgi:hypothetical protein